MLRHKAIPSNLATTTDMDGKYRDEKSKIGGRDVLKLNLIEVALVLEERRRYLSAQPRNRDPPCSGGTHADRTTAEDNALREARCSANRKNTRAKSEDSPRGKD